jgi:cytochrome b
MNKDLKIMNTEARFPLWDSPTRLFHWLLVIAVFLSWLSHELEWIQVHLWSGYSVLVLVGFRLLWGFWGSVHSRFRDFVSSPARVWAYWRRGEWSGVGHNPAGAWSVLALLLLLAAQALTGLFNSDGLLFDGPLHYALASSWTDKLGELHEWLFWVLAGLIGLHVAAVLYSQFFGARRNLLRPMISGGDSGREAPVPAWRALVLLLLCAGLLGLAVYLAPSPPVYW